MMAVDSGSVSKQSVSEKKGKIMSPNKNESISKAKKSPGSKGIVILSSTEKRIYDSVDGKNCHQCRHKTRDLVAACTAQKKNKPCGTIFCQKCLLNRYGEKVEEIASLGEWNCPKCRGICNCSICMKKRGHQPTGVLTSAAKKTGFSSVSEMLLKGQVVYTDTVATPKKEGRGKENSFDGKVDANLPNHIDKKSKKVNAKTVVSSEEADSHLEKKPKKMKLERSNEINNVKNDRDTAEETTTVHDEKKLKKSTNGTFLARRTSPRKPIKMANKGKNVEHKIIVTKKGKRKKEDDNSENHKNDFEHQISNFVSNTPLASVAGIDVPAEDVGNALQFLEFCAVFGKVLELKKGEPEYVLQDIYHGRIGRTGKLSAPVLFHIHLLYFIQKDRGEDAKLSESHRKNSWFVKLKEYLSESPSVFKALELDDVADYEILDASKKLRILSLLCDAVLETEKIRNWIEDRNKEHAEKIKEAKRNKVAAKEKKLLRQKRQDCIPEAAKVRAMALESRDTLLKNNLPCDALRTEPMFIDQGGHAYWKMNCYGKSEVVSQSVGKGDTLTLGEKWFAISSEGKEAIEKQVSSLT